MRRRLRGVAVTLLALVAAGCGHGHGAGRVVVLQSEAPPRPSTSLADWVTYADDVVVVRVTGERAGHSPARVHDRGFIRRFVTFDVVSRPWTSPREARPMPDTVTMEVDGWEYGDPSDRVPYAVAGSSRVEVGHTYLLALFWQPALCSPGDPKQAAHYAPLGPGAALPADGGTVGAGEFEGVVGKPAALSNSGEIGDLVTSLAGRPTASVKGLLATTAPENRRDYGPIPAPCH